MDRLRRREVFPAGGFPAAGDVVSLRAAVEVHAHDFLEVAVLLDGSVVSLTAEGRQVLRAGAVTAVRPGQWHGYADPEQAVIGNLYLGEELLHRELRWLLDVGDLSRFLLRGGVSAEGLASSGRAAVSTRLAELAELAGSGPGTAAAVQAVGLATTVLAELARVRLGAGPTTEAFSPAVRRTVLLLGREPQRPWTMAELAAEVGHSVSHLHREFRGQLGATPMAWLARTRAEVAASLLVQTDQPVAWVGQQVGWPDPNYFSRCFRRAHGLSPTAYRARNAPPAPGLGSPHRTHERPTTSP